MTDVLAACAPGAGVVAVGPSTAAMTDRAKWPAPTAQRHATEWRSDLPTDDLATVPSCCCSTPGSALPHPKNPRNSSQILQPINQNSRNINHRQ